MNEHIKRPVVFIDRDGTLNVEVGYVTDLSQLELLPGADEAIRLLNEANVAAIVVTNQSGVARGFYPESHVQNVNRAFVQMLSDRNAVIDALYYCPHHKGGVVSEFAIACACRKPATGLLDRAFAEFSNLDRGRAYMIGDQSTDIELARNFGIKSVMVTTGLGRAVLAGEFQWRVEPDYIADTVLHAVQWVLADLNRTL